MAIIFKPNIQNKIREANPRSKRTHPCPVRAEPGRAPAAGGRRAGSSSASVDRPSSQQTVRVPDGRRWALGAGHWAFGSRPRHCDGREGARCPSRTPTVIASQRCRAPARRPSLRTRWWSAHWRGRRGAPSAGTGVGPQSRRQAQATRRAGLGSRHHSQSVPWRDSSSWALAGPRGLLLEAASLLPRAGHGDGSGTVTGHAHRPRRPALGSWGWAAWGPFPSLPVPHSAATTAPGVALTAPCSHPLTAHSAGTPPNAAPALLPATPAPQWWVLGQPAPVSL